MPDNVSNAAKRSGSILIANRGEIAVRIMRTARLLGYRTVAIYSEADRGMSHALMADKAVCIGPAPAASSYLDIRRVIDAAIKTGATMIHPGYGFLSENEAFAKACAAADITFIGPPPEAIRQMGDKAIAKRIMLEAGVPCIPGYDGANQDLIALAKEAERIGFPVMVKAVAGGGGKGIRLVESAAELEDAVRMARSEAEKSFANGQLMLEKAVIAPRHVEVQVFADVHGGAVHLGDRDCSIQRRHQKVIEEAPAPGIADEVRQAMGLAAVRAAQAVDYVGAGTVEFLIDRGGNFYFLEMNTRLQVEHPVTEMVTGLDLVEWQIRVAQGEPLPLTQSEIMIRGHSIEARLYAEDPAAEFMPQSGRIEQWLPPIGAGIRVDHGLKDGAWISTWYDPMIAKVIASGKDREEARRRLVRALQDCVVVGLPTNRPLLLGCLQHSDFIDLKLSTSFIARCVPDIDGVPPPGEEIVALAAALLWTREANSQSEAFRGWRSSGWFDQPLALRCGEYKSIVHISSAAKSLRVTLTQRHVDVELIADEPGWGRASLNGIDRNFQLSWAGEKLTIALGEQPYGFSLWLKQAPGANEDGVPSARAPMPGTVVAVYVKQGDPVARGDVLLAMEAMKMETLIRAPSAGTVLSLHCAAGQQVALKQLLVEIQPAA